MKTACILITALSLIAATAMQAQVKWLETRHNFGAFAEEVGPVECRFYFVNTGSEPVTVVSTRASCGCTTPKYDRAPVAPGDTSSILVIFDPAGRPGHFSKTVAADFSSGGPRTKLYIEGTVIGSESSVSHRFPIACGTDLRLARGVVLMGEINKGQLRPVYLDAYNRSADTIVPAASHLPKYIDVTVAPAQVPPGQQFTYIFYMHSAKCPLYGAVNDTVHVSAGAGSPGCDIPLVAMIKEDFSKLSSGDYKKAPVVSVGSTHLDFGRLGSEVVTRTTTVLNSGKSPLKIRRVYTTDPGVTVSVSADTVKKGKDAVVTVTVNPAQLPGKMLNARINLITSDPVNPVLVIRAVGEL